MINEKELEVLFAAKKLSDAEKQILTFIANNLEQAIHLGAQGIAQHCYTSSATVVRLAKKLGYDGSREMLYEFERTAKEFRKFVAHFFQGANIDAYFGQMGELLDGVARRCYTDRERKWLEEYEQK